MRVLSLVVSARSSIQFSIWGTHTYRIVGVAVIDAEHDQYALCVAIVAPSYRLELVLPSRVPDLQLYPHILQLHDFEYVIETDRGHMVLSKAPAAVAK